MKAEDTLKIKNKYKHRLLILIITIFLLFRVVPLSFFELKGYSTETQKKMLLEDTIYPQQTTILQQNQRSIERQLKRLLSSAFFLSGNRSLDIYGYLLRDQCRVHIRIIDHRETRIQLLTMYMHGSRYKDIPLIVG